MENKVYFFARHSRREITKKTQDTKRAPIQPLVLPKPHKILSIIPNNSIIASPYNTKKKISLSPLHDKSPKHPRAKSYKSVNNKSSRLSSCSRLKSSSPNKINIRYLKQDYEDIEVMNGVRTPEDSRKNSEKKFSTDWLLPDLEEFFASSNSEMNQIKSNVSGSICLKGVKKARFESKKFDFENRNTAEE